MKLRNIHITTFLLILTSATITASANAAESPAVSERLSAWQVAGASSFSSEHGQALWQSTQDGRSCGSCHGKDLTQPGKHQRTGKSIAPMAPSANPKRLSNAAFMEKWLKRNCQWTFQRECTPQEKGDLIRWLSQQ